MGNNNAFKTKYNNEKEVKLDITLNKICYLPGEQITGNLDIQPKNGINETILNDTNATIKIIQLQYYSYTVGSGDDETTISESDEKDILIQNFDFINFKGANILSGINISFSINIPLNVHASLIYYGNYVKHFLLVDFPGIKAKRTIMIIIKRFEKFSNENKLLRIPANAFGDFYKKKKFSYKGGKVTCLLKLPKNRFYYFELIPLEIYLDRSELNMEVKAIKLSLRMKIHFNYKDDEEKHQNTDMNLELFAREYLVNNSQNKFQVKDYIQLQNDDNYLKYISINDKYCLLEDMKKIEIDHKFENMIIPFCFGGLINPEYIFQVEIIYKKHRSKSIFSLPIDIYSHDDDASLSIDKSDKINNIVNNDENKNNNCFKDINSLDEDNLEKNMAESDGFVVFEEDDFEKAFFEGKNK